MEKEINIPLVSESDICPKCKGTGRYTYTLYDEDLQHDYEYSTECPACNGGLIRRSREWSERSSIPEKYRNATWDSFRWDVYTDNNGKLINTSEKKSIIDSFLNEYPDWNKEGKGLYIYSRTKGSGKTFSVSCIGNSIISKYGKRVRFVSAVNLISLSQNADKNSPSESERDPISDMAKVPLLILDDLGVKDSNSWIDEILFTIIDGRNQRLLPTIITSNMPSKELPYNDRIVDRINESCVEIHMPEVCVRAREANQNKMEFLKRVDAIKREGNS